MKIKTFKFEISNPASDQESAATFGLSQKNIDKWNRRFQSPAEVDLIVNQWLTTQNIDVLDIKTTSYVSEAKECLPNVVNLIYTIIYNEK